MGRKARPRTLEGAASVLTSPLASRAKTWRPVDQARAPSPRAGERVDPFAFFMRDPRAAAIGADQRDPAVVAAGRQRRAGFGGDEDGGVRMNGDAARLAGAGEKHMAVAQRQRGRGADEGRRRDRRARVNRGDIRG